jgi:hypothetical protein
MITLDNIHSLTDFKRNTSAYVEKMKDTKAPATGRIMSSSGQKSITDSHFLALLDLVHR